MDRGNQFVESSSVTQESTKELSQSAASWLEKAVQADGRLVYKYWPSPGEESDSNNIIRQWMATIALEKIVKSRSDPA